MQTIDITPSSSEYIFSGGSKKSSSGGKGGGKTRQPKEYKNTLESKSEISVVYLVSEGEVQDLQGQDLLKAVYLDDTPVMNSNGTLNFKGIRAGFRPGTLTQSHIPGVTSSENESLLNQEVIKNQGSIIRQISNPDIQSIRVKFTIPALSLLDEKTGDIKPNNVGFSVDIEVPGGGYVNRIKDVISGKCTTPYEVAYKIQLPPSPTGTWNVRVTRLTPDSVSDKNQNKLVFTSITTIIDAKFTYPTSALLSLRVNSDNFSALPSVKLKMKGKKVLIPSNYDPINKTYVGVWDGTFKFGYTNNPCWILYDLLLNGRYGLGKYINSSLIDKWSLYGAAQYCDQRVSNYRGGTECRFEFNGVISEAQDAITLLSQITSVFRSSVIWSGGVIEVIQDKPQVPEKFFSPANVLLQGQAATFSYTSSGKSSRHSTALITYINPTLNWTPDIESVENAETFTKYGYNSTRIEALGCTSSGQAHRLGLWTLLTEQLLTETVTFSVGMEGATVKPGSVIQISDSMKQGGFTQGGRILRNSGITAVLDAPWGSLFVNPQDTINYYSSTTGQMVAFGIASMEPSPDGFTQVVYYSHGDHPPIDQSPFLIKSNILKPRLYRVLDVTNTSQDDYKGVYEITALQYNESIYDAVDFGAALFNPPNTIQPPVVPNKPYNVTGKSYAILREARWIFSLQGYWSTPTYGGINDPYTSYYEIQYKEGVYGNWRDLVASSTAFVEYPNLAENIYFLRVRAVDVFKRASEWVESPQVLCTRPIPASPIGTINKQLNLDNSMYLSFSDTQIYTYGISGYLVTVQPQGQPESNFQFIPLGTYYTNPLNYPPGMYTVRIYAVDVTNQKSANALTVVIGSEFAPASPSGVMTVNTIDDTTLQFFWTDNTEHSESFAGYRLYRQWHIQGATPHLVEETTNKFSQSLQHDDRFGASYTIRAFNTKNYESLGALEFVLEKDALAYTVPNPMGTIRKIPASDGGIILRWTDGQVYDEKKWAGYRIYINGTLIGTSAVKEYFSYFPENPSVNNTVTVKAYYKSGLQSSTAITTTLVPEDFYPPVPSYLMVDQTLRGLKQFYWELPETAPVDISKFRVKYSRGTTKDWDNAHLLKDVLAGEKSLDTELFREGTYTIMVKTVDVTNLESLNFVFTSINLFDPVPENVVESWSYNSPSSSSPPMSGSPWLSRSPRLHNLRVTPENTLEVIDDSQEAYYENTFEPTQDGHMKAVLNGTGNYRLEYKRAVLGVFWDETKESSIFWLESNSTVPLWVSSEAWLSLPVEVQVHQEEYTVRVYWLTGGGSLNYFSILVDAPDIYMSYEDVAISALGNTRIYPTKPVRYIKSATLTLQDTGTQATSLIVLEKDAVNGVMVQARNASGGLTHAVVDAVLVGY